MDYILRLPTVKENSTSHNVQRVRHSSKCRYQGASDNFEVLIRGRKIHALTLDPITLGPLVVNWYIEPIGNMSTD